MTPFFATNAVLERPELATSKPRATQIEQMALSDSSPWLYSALSKLRDIQDHGQLIPGVGDLRISDTTATNARLLLSLIDIIDLPVPVVAPISGGAVSLTWSMGAKEVKYSFYPDGNAVYFRCADDNVINGCCKNSCRQAARMPPAQDDYSISNERTLFRILWPQWSTLKDGQARPTSDSLQDSNFENSCFVEGEISLEELRSLFPGLKIARIPTELLRGQGFAIERRPAEAPSGCTAPNAHVVVGPTTVLGRKEYERRARAIVRNSAVTII
jgi:hypothetical protein